jgi:hypothetical protein
MNNDNGFDASIVGSYFYVSNSNGCRVTFSLILWAVAVVVVVVVAVSNRNGQTKNKKNK